MWVLAPPVSSQSISQLLDFVYKIYCVPAKQQLHTVYDAT